MNDHLVFMDFGSFEIYWNGFLVSLSILIGSLLYCRLRSIQGQAFSDVLTTVIWALPVAFVCSRFCYCWFRQASFTGGMDEYLCLFNGGSSLLGAVAGVLIVLLLRCRKGRKEIVPTLDAAAPALALMIATGRWASVTCNEETGFEIVSSSPLPFLVWSESQNAYLLWVGFFEGIFALMTTGLTAFLFWQLYRRKKASLGKGCAVLCFMLTYGLSQALLESMKNDSLFMVTLGFVRIDQIVSILIAVVAIVIICMENVRVGGFSLKKLLLWIICAAALATAVVCEFSLNATYLAQLYLCMGASLFTMWIIAAGFFLNTAKIRRGEAGDSTAPTEEQV